MALDSLEIHMIQKLTIMDIGSLNCVKTTPLLLLMVDFNMCHLVILHLDYYIAITKAYKLIEHFEIKSLDSLYSDGHSVLSCSIKINTNNRQTGNTLKNSHSKSKWSSTQQTDSSKTSILKKLNNYYKIAENNPSQINIDQISQTLSTCFTKVPNNHSPHKKHIQ